MRPLHWLIVSLALTAPITAGATDWDAQSPSTQVPLVELYTSQGCSSCPPADQWLGRMMSRDDLWTGVVPVAWHVTYWNSLGWKDPFSLRQHDQRQRLMAQNAGTGVYTPGVFLDRREWQAWRKADSKTPALTTEPVGQLIARQRGATVSITFQPAPGKHLEAPRVELVYLRSGQGTAVKLGENRGRTLHNDFVAGPLHRQPLRPAQGQWMAQFEAIPGSDSNAVAIWIVNGSGELIQASGTWLKDS